MRRGEWWAAWKFLVGGDCKVSAKRRLIGCPPIAPAVTTSHRRHHARQSSRGASSVVGKASATHGGWDAMPPLKAELAGPPSQICDPLPPAQFLTAPCWRASHVRPAAFSTALFTTAGDKASLNWWVKKHSIQLPIAKPCKY